MYVNSHAIKNKYYSYRYINFQEFTLRAIKLELMEKNDTISQTKVLLARKKQ